MSQKHRQQKSTQVRGSELKDKMVQSQVEGEEFRSENFGTDQLDSNVRHHKVTTAQREIKERTKK